MRVVGVDGHLNCSYIVPVMQTRATMAKTDNKEIREPLGKLSPSAAVSEQIQRALEMMKRVRTVNVGKVDKTLEESQGNRYIVPEPLVLRVSETSSG